MDFSNMNATAPIKLKEALQLMRERSAEGQEQPFQLAFYPTNAKLKEFKRISIPAALITALPKQHRHKPYLIGIRPLVQGKHNYSVHSKLITQFNNQPVVP